MNIPVFSDTQYVDEEGFLTSSMQIYNDQLNQVLQNGLSDNGWTLPLITAAELSNIYTTMPDGTVWYETDNKEVVFKINGSLVKALTGIYP